MKAAVDKDVALASLRVWVLGDIEVVLPLVRYGAQVRALDSIEALYRELPLAPCDVLLLDTASLDEDVSKTVAGFQRRDDPILVVMVPASTPDATTAALWAGAHACLPVFASADVLASTLYSLRRRLPAAAELPVSGQGTHLQDWALESDGWDIRAPSGSVLALTEAERAFLTVLFASPAEVVPRERLIHALTAQPWSFDPHRVEVLVHRLRARLRKATGDTLPIRAIRGIGYRLTS